MTFTEIQTAITDRLNLSSSAATTRIGNAINERYRRLTSTLGLNVTRRTQVQSDTTAGVSTLTFTTIEKVISIIDENAKVLEEVSVDEIRAIGTLPASDSPTKYAIYRMNDDTVTILLNVNPQNAFTLYADGYAEISTISGSTEPAFPESFHDILINGVLADEYRKLEKLALAKDAEQQYEKRLSELRMFIAKSAYRDIYQGKKSPVSEGGATGASATGTTSYTQTGLITFDRDPSAPFAVTSGSAVVTNLDADKLDGYDWQTIASTWLWATDNTYDIGDSDSRPRDVYIARNADIDGTLNVAGITTLQNDLIFANDNTDDIGAAGATRPRDLHVARNADIDGTLDVAGVSTLRANLLFSADASHDIGAAGATRPRDFHMSRNALIGGTLGVTGLITGRDVTVVTSTTTGATNNWAPGIATGTTLIQASGAALAATGLDGGSAGCVVIIRNTGSGTLTFAHASGSSDADNRFTNSLTTVVTPVAAGGYIIYIHDGTNWDMVAHDQGAWISFTPTFAGWTLGDGTSFGRYRIEGNTVHVEAGFNHGTTSAVAGGLALTLPFTAPAIDIDLQNVGTILCNDGNATFYGGMAYKGSTTTVAPLADNGTSYVVCSSTVPMTWANTDEFSMTIRYYIT